MVNFMIKPASFNCNIGCKYCFYLEKQDFMSVDDYHSGKHMDIYKAKQFIEKRIKEEKGKDIYFTWQGGEPLLAGLDFYKTVVEIQEALGAVYGKRIHNAVQTNGILITEKWAEFLKEKKFLVGISIDGDEALHNVYRKTVNGGATFDKVMRGLKNLQKKGVEFNTLTVVNDKNVKYPLEVYRFLKSIGSRFMQFIPVIETLDIDENYKPKWIDDKDFVPRKTGFSVNPLEYGKFMSAVFDEWISKDVSQVSIRMFDSLLARFAGYEQTLCVFKEECGGNNLALEADGTVYQCDHFVYPESKFKIGNIKEMSLAEIEEKSKKLSDVKKDISRKCQECKWLELCHGGCPKHRFVNSGDTQEKISYFCEGYKYIFEHITPGLNLILEFKNKQIPWKYLPAAVEEMNKRK